MHKITPNKTQKVSDNNGALQTKQVLVSNKYFIYT